ncbi:MAG: hypothetical protein GY793_03635 [Proteobacteria bacterium]|nr:hypothetical protein [Pseudomonadota bacterium]
MSEVKYKWIADNGENSCEACAEHDGEIFDSLEDVPELPVHPNCKCMIEAVMDEDVESMAGEIESILEKISENVDEIENELKSMLKESSGYIRNQINNFLDGVYQVQKSIEVFSKNRDDMKEIGWIGGDKYFHAKANAEATQLGNVGYKMASFLSDLREFAQVYTDTIWKGYTLQDIKKDMDEDQAANSYGRLQGKENPDADPKELVKVWRPKGLPEKY